MNNSFISALLAVFGVVAGAMITATLTYLSNRGSQQITGWKEWRDDVKELREESTAQRLIIDDLKKKVAELEANALAHAQSESVLLQDLATYKRKFAEASEREAAVRYDLIAMRDERDVFRDGLNECLDLYDARISGREVSASKMDKIEEKLRLAGYLSPPVKPDPNAPIEQLTRDGRKTPDPKLSRRTEPE